MKREVPGKVAGVQQGLHPTVHAIVLDALTKQVGGTLIRNSDLRDMLGVGMSSVHRALDLLAERGALQTVGRGQLGRRIETLDVGECWQAAGLAPVDIVLSPSGPIEMNVMQDALTGKLSEMTVPYTVRHHGGGVSRLRLVLDGPRDVSVVSAATYQSQLHDIGPGHHVAQLPLTSYYAPLRLVTVHRRADRGGTVRRVAIDSTSRDHEVLTRAEFPAGSGVTYVEVPFTEVPAYVLAGAVDAGIWHISPSPVPPYLAGLDVVPLQTPQGQEVENAVSSAVIVGTDRRPELRSVVDTLGRSLDDFESRQQELLVAEERQRARLAECLAEAHRPFLP